jgi:NADPH-dependent 2,4-dienoyl-CoA reductase/sulfur reductase-like enzyme
VYTLGAAQIALKYQACAIGSRTVFVGSTPLLYLAAYQYARAGACVAAVVDTGTWGAKASGTRGMLAAPAMIAKGLYYMAALRARRVPVFHGAAAIEFTGTSAVDTVRLRLPNGEAREIACDAVAMGFHLRSETQLAELAGCGFEYDTATRQWAPAVDEDGRAGSGVYLAGDGMRIGGADAAETGGSLAALALLADCGVLSRDDARIAKLRSAHRRQLSFQRGVLRAFPFPQSLVENAPDDVLLCRCESISVGAYRAAAATGLDTDDVNRRKAFSRVGMGRCQGRYCGLAAMDVLAAQRAIPPQDAGRLRAQAPVKPLPLSATADESARAA